MQISFGPAAMPKTGTVVVPALDGGKLPGAAAALDRQTGGLLKRAMRTAAATGKNGSFVELLAPAATRLERILIAGLGKPADRTLHDFENLGGRLVKRLAAASPKRVTVLLDAIPGLKPEPAEICAHAAFGATLGGYRFDKYLTRKSAGIRKKEIGALVLATRQKQAAARAFKALDALAAGVTLARDLVHEPPNVLYPEAFAAEVKKLARLGVKVEILNEPQMKRLGMNALLGVGQGSRRESRLAVMRWQGGGKNDPTAAFVGKGVCFDTGGISLKPPPNMDAMKADMGGAACVTGLFSALARRKARVNAAGVIGLVENMPGGNAQRPGDIVTSMSGQTIEILNTDAEGRLVLADALCYAQTKFKPAVLIDLATLTGAILIALGQEYAGLFSNDDTLAQRLAGAGEAEGERVWRLPMAKNYDEMIDSKNADVKNIGGGRNAGSITAAQFLKRFVTGTHWAHIDIAGTAMATSPTPLSPGWASGFGVRLLNRFLIDNYEKPARR